MKKIYLLLMSAVLAACSGPKKAETIAIIPKPVQMTVDPSGTTYKLAALQDIWNIEAQPMDKESVREGHYQLEVKPEGITIRANDFNGEFYARQTLMQLLPPEVYSPEVQKKNEAYLLPCVTIEDYPRFGYRGMHLDVSRHFFDADFVKKYIDLLAMHKLNIFHWHLVDDQGWRLEITKYPKLTEKSAWRVDRRDMRWEGVTPPKPGEEPSYGGFYTQDEVREIVAYAKERGIKIVPEIEMPGHTEAVFAAYPELSCLGKEQFVTPGGLYTEDMATCFCAGNEAVFTFLEEVIDEVIELFPDAPYIHIGGDEVDKGFWKNCPKCQARMKAEKLNDADELQSYFITRMEKYINSKGYPIIGWDEILEGGLAPNATVMSWRGIAGGVEAAKMGHDVVMTPGTHLYFDHYQNNPEVEPVAMSGYTTVGKVYSYEPIPEELTAEEAKHILGAQANVWAEHMQTPEHVEYMVLPRMSALAEVVWSPKGTTGAAHLDDFMERLQTQYKRFDAMGANSHPGADQVNYDIVFDSVNQDFSVSLTTEFYKGDIYYTTDGTEPTLNSTKYAGPLKVSESVVFNVIVGRDGKRVSKGVSEIRFGFHKGFGKQVTYNTLPSPQYPGHDRILVDGFEGSLNHMDGRYQGFVRGDMDIVVDLEAPAKFSEVSASFLQSAGAWIYRPAELVVSVSDDGKNFTEVGRQAKPFNGADEPNLHDRFTVKGDFEGRYVRIVAVNAVAPKGVAGAGLKNWIFADEVSID